MTFIVIKKNYYIVVQELEITRDTEREFVTNARTKGCNYNENSNIGCVK